ncbi:MAG TPA: rod shape-determining protein MreD [Verrucomicrobiae bacterium]|nr:rod shape-determining protein MreD [Verrucomicrobiae bacterium]
MNAITSILVLLAAALAVFWESAFQGIRHLLGAQIDLLPGLIVYASLSTGLFTTSLTAVTAGLLFDSLSANPLGVTVLPLLLVGILIHSQRELILRDQVFAQFILGLAASAIAPLLTLLLILTRGEPPLLGWGSLWQWIVLAVGGAIATPIWFLAFGLFDRTFNYQRARETTFRADREIRRGRK